MQKKLNKALAFALALVMALGMIPVAGQVQAAGDSGMPTSMEGLSIAYPYNTETIQQTGSAPSRFSVLTFESARGEVESAQMIL